MKKAFSIVLFLIAISLTASAFAEWKSYDIESVGITVSFPESYYVFYDGMEDNDLANMVFGGNTEAVIDFIKSRGAHVYIVFDDFETEATITYTHMNTYSNLDSISLAALKDAGKSIANEFEAMGAETIDTTPYEINGKRVLQITLKVNVQGETNYRSIHMMAMGDRMIQFLFTSMDNPFTPDEVEIFKKICGTVKSL